MKTIHPDMKSKALIIFNICVISTIALSMVFYYHVFDDTIEHQQKLNQSMFISFLISITVCGIISNKYMRKRKEKIVDKDIS